jgi:hypothetical protein
VESLEEVSSRLRPSLLLSLLVEPVLDADGMFWYPTSDCGVIRAFNAVCLARRHVYLPILLNDRKILKYKRSLPMQASSNDLAVNPFFGARSVFSVAAKNLSPSTTDDMEEFSII